MQYNGVAPDAKIAFDDIGDASGDISVPADFASNLFPHSYAAGARTYSISWGSTAIYYDMMAMQIDKFVFLHDDFVVLVAAGNDGPTAWSVGSPATAKNILAVGATENRVPLPTDNIQIRFSSTASGFELTCNVMAVAAFGPSLLNVPPITKTLALASPVNGCSAIQMASGKVVLIERGLCTFQSKVFHAQAAGAVAVIIFNNIPDTVITMGETDTVKINIPSAFISQNNVAVLLQHIAMLANISAFLNVTMPFASVCGTHTAIRHTLADISGRGPTDGLRLKPDVLCPGIGIYSANSDGTLRSQNCGMNLDASMPQYR